MGLRWGPSCFGLEGYFTNLISGPLPAGPYRQRCEKAGFRATTIRPVSETTERMKDAETQWFKKTTGRVNRIRWPRAHPPETGLC
jgi:hypothetical protein